MALQSTGSITFANLRAEYVGGSAAISLGDLYRGGSNIRANASNNNSTNLSAQVPASGAIAMNQFYSQAKGFKATESTNRSNKDASDYFGDDYSVDYPKTLVISSTITNNNLNGIALNFPSGLDGDTTLTVNGTIRSYSGYAIRNQSSTSITVDGSGSIRKNNKTDWVSALQSVGGSVSVDFLGGFGGASGPDIRHSDYSSVNMRLKLTRTASTTWNVSWTYNELDYGNRGSGSVNISSSSDVNIPQNADGSFNESDTSTHNFSSNVASGGRDTRNIAFGTKIISGVRYMWFGTNNKSTSMDVGNNRYIQHGHTQTTLTTSNSKHSTLLQTYTGNHSTGTFSISGPTLTTG